MSSLFSFLAQNRIFLLILCSKYITNQTNIYFSNTQFLCNKNKLSGKHSTSVPRKAILLYSEDPLIRQSPCLFFIKKKLSSGGN